TAGGTRAQVPNRFCWAKWKFWIGVGGVLLISLTVGARTVWSQPQIRKDGTAVVLQDYWRVPLSSTTTGSYPPPIDFTNQLGRANQLSSAQLSSAPSHPTRPNCSGWNGRSDQRVRNGYHTPDFRHKRLLCTIVLLRAIHSLHRKINASIGTIHFALDTSE